MIAGVRNPNNAKDLHELKEENGDKLSIVQLDITDEGSIEVKYDMFNRIFERNIVLMGKSYGRDMVTSKMPI